VVATIEAMKLARESGLDLVEISPNAAPPVCKILDYGKYKYELKKKAQEAKKKQVVVKLKEVKMRPGTDEHDFQFKLRHIKRFLEEGDKAKITVVFKGREMAYQDLGRQVMGRILEEVKDKAKVEQSPSMEGKSLIMVLAPQ
jgi:translation initiation factor IF-3